MKKWVLMVLLGVALATTIGGCKKGGGGWGLAQCGAHVVYSKNTYRNCLPGEIQYLVEQESMEFQKALTENISV